jgi:hypothetical protein
MSLPDFFLIDDKIQFFGVRQGGRPTPADLQYMLNSELAEEDRQVLANRPMNFIAYAFEEIPQMAATLKLPHEDINNQVFTVVAANAAIGLLKEPRLQVTGMTITLDGGKKVDLLHFFAGTLPDGSGAWLVTLVDAPTNAAADANDKPPVTSSVDWDKYYEERARKGTLSPAAGVNPGTSHQSSRNWLIWALMAGLAILLWKAC